MLTQLIAGSAVLFRAALVLLERAESQLLENIARELPNSNADVASGGETHALGAASESDLSMQHQRQHANGVAPAAFSREAAVDGGGALSEAALLALNSALVFNVLSDQPTTLSARVRHAAPGDESECARFVADMERYRESVTAELVDSERLKFVAELMALQGMHVQVNTILTSQFTILYTYGIAYASCPIY